MMNTTKLYGISLSDGKSEWLLQNPNDKYITLAFSKKEEAVKTLRFVQGHDIVGKDVQGGGLVGIEVLDDFSGYSKYFEEFERQTALNKLTSRERKILGI